MYKWNNKRFVYLSGYPCSVIFLGFAIVFFYEKCIEGGIGFTVMSLVTFLLIIFNKKFDKKIPVNEKNKLLNIIFALQIISTVSAFFNRILLW